MSSTSCDDLYDTKLMTLAQITVAWVVVLVRKHYFTTHLDGMVQQELARSPAASTILVLDTLKEFTNSTRRRPQESAARSSSWQTSSDPPEPNRSETPRPRIRIVTATMQRPESLGPGRLSSLPVPDGRSYKLGSPDMLRPPPTHNEIFTRSPTPISPGSLHPVNTRQTSHASVRPSPSMEDALESMNVL